MKKCLQETIHNGLSQQDTKSQKNYQFAELKLEVEKETYVDLYKINTLP